MTQAASGDSRRPPPGSPAATGLVGVVVKCVLQFVDERLLNDAVGVAAWVEQVGPLLLGVRPCVFFSRLPGEQDVPFRSQVGGVVRAGGITEMLVYTEVRHLGDRSAEGDGSRAEVVCRGHDPQALGMNPEVFGSVALDRPARPELAEREQRPGEVGMTVQRQSVGHRDRRLLRATRRSVPRRSDPLRAVARSSVVLKSRASSACSRRLAAARSSLKMAGTSDSVPPA